MANEVEVKVSVEEKQALRALTKLTKSVDKFEKEAVTSFKNTSTAFDTFKGFLAANVVTSGLKSLTSAVVNFGTTAVNKAAEIESLENRFITLTQSADTAKGLIEDLTTFSANTPFQLDGLAEASAKLLAFQTDVEDVIPRLTQIGDVAAGAGVDINELTLIFGQVQAATKLTGERLIQLEERAIPIGKAIANTMGIAESAVRDMVSAGKVDFKTFEAAFESLSQDGGQFFQGMIRQSKTAEGVFSTLSDNTSIFFQKIGQAMLPTIKLIATDLISALQNAAKWIKQNDGVIKDFISGLLQIVAAGAKVIDWGIRFGRMVTEQIMRPINDARRMFLATKLVLAEFGLVSKESALKAANSLKELSKSAIEARTLTKTSFSGIADAAESMADRVEAANNKAAGGDGEMGPQPKKEAVEDPENSAEVIFERQKNELLAEIREEQKELLMEQKEIEREEKTLEGEERLENLRKQQKIQTDIKNNAELERNANEAKNRKDISKINQKQDEQDLKKEIDLEKRKLDAKKKAAADEKVIRDTQLKTTANFLQAGLTLAKEGSTAQKALLTAQAIMNTYAAATNALATPAPYPVALAFSLSAIAVGLANVAKINGAKFAEGGFVAGSSMVGDQVPILANSGEFVANRKQQDNILEAVAGGNFERGGGNEEMMQMMMEIADRPVVVEIDGREIARATRNAETDGFRVA